MVGTTGYHVYTNRYYTSPLLAKELYSMNMNIHLTGTVNPNRKELPDQVKPASTKKLKKGEVIGVHNDTLSVLVRKDKRVVIMLSTLYDDSVQDVSRRIKSGEGV